MCFRPYTATGLLTEGKDGALPIAPIYWYVFPNLEKLSVKDTFNISPMDQFDLTKVVVTG